MGDTTPHPAHAGRRPTADASQPQCVIPNCAFDVDQWGDTCPDCLRAFGAHLRPSATPALNHQQILDRDSYVDRALAVQRQIRDGGQRVAATATQTRRGRRA